jgi:hypothetical protein
MTDNAGNSKESTVSAAAISSIMFSSVDEDERQKRMESMELSRMNFDVCHTCNDSEAIIFDAENNETVCSS